MSQKTLDSHFAKLDMLLEKSQLQKSILSYSTLFRQYLTNSIGCTWSRYCQLLSRVDRFTRTLADIGENAVRLVDPNPKKSAERTSLRQHFSQSMWFLSSHCWLLDIKNSDTLTDMIKFECVWVTSLSEICSVYFISVSYDAKEIMWWMRQSIWERRGSGTGSLQWMQAMVSWWMPWLICKRCWWWILCVNIVWNAPVTQLRSLMKMKMKTKMKMMMKENSDSDEEEEDDESTE